MSQPIQDQNSTEQQTETPQGGDAQNFTPSPAETQSINPIYAEALNTVPQEFHRGLTEHFKRWDENHANSLKKWEPYKEFEGVDPQQLRAARQVWDTISTDPVGVYQRMQQQLMENGLIPGPEHTGQQPVVQQQNPEVLQQNYNPDGNSNGQQQAPPVPDVIDQRLTMVEQFAQWQIAQAQQAQAQQEAQQLENEVVGQLNGVLQKWGSGDQVRDKQFMDQVLERMAMANSAGTRITAEQAAQQIQTYNDQVIADYAAQRRVAPRVVPANGGIPASATVRPEDMTEAQRREYGRWIASGRQGALNI